MKKKKAFALIEVLIAIALSTAACMFLLSFENSLIIKTKQSLQKLEDERLTQQASVMLFEQLYTQQIDWKTICDEGSYETRLENSDWIARYDFSHIKKTNDTLADCCYVFASISLQKGAYTLSDVAKLALCLKREEGTNAIAVPT